MIQVLDVFSQMALGKSFTQNDYSGEDKEKLLHVMQRHIKFHDSSCIRGTVYDIQIIDHLP